MASTQTRQWGVTPPISFSLPTDAEIDIDDALIAELKRQNNFETSDETEKRYVSLVFYGTCTNRSYRKSTLQLIQKVTVEFVKLVSKRRNLPVAGVEAAGGKIFTFGSYRLGVYGPGERNNQ